MRIAVIVHGFPPAVEAGCEIYARDHAVALHRAYGDTILVVTRDADPGRDEYDVRIDSRDGLTIASINNTFADVRSFEDSYRNETIGAIAAALIDDFTPDVAHLHHLTCLSTTIVRALADRGIPIVLTLHDYWLMCHRGQLLDRDYQVCDGPGADGCAACLDATAGMPQTLRRAGRAFPAVARALRRSSHGVARRGAGLVSSSRVVADQTRRRVEHMRKVCGAVTQFVAPSRAMRDRFIAFGVPPDRLTLRPYGFDRAGFRGVTRTTADRSPEGSRSLRLRLGFLGSVMVSKAPHVLLEAVTHLPRGSVSVDLFGGYAPYHGDDGYRTRLDGLVAQDGVRAHGAIPHDRVAAALASIDVLVVPSIWPENSPLVIGEAFLAGVPVVASNIGGIPEVVADGHNGLLFEAGNAADLARVLKRLLGEPGLLDSLRTGAAATAVRPMAMDVQETRAMYAAAIASRETRRRRRAAVVLNYRAAPDTLLAVRSLLAQRAAIDDIIVVDNDTGGAAGAALAGVVSRITYLRAERNLGYSGGMNLGIREALGRGADRILLVNSDVVVPPDCVERLERCLDATPGSGIAGPVVLARSDPDRIASIGMSYDGWNGRMRHGGFGDDAASLVPAASRVVDGVSGCLMLVARDVFDAIGLFDEDYFFSFEDLDFCLRARRAGFATVLAGLAAVHHEGGRSIGARSPRRLYFAARGHLLLARRAGPPVNVASAALRTVSIVVLNIAHAIRSTGAPLPVRLAAVARGVRDYFAGRFGPDAEAT